MLEVSASASLGGVEHRVGLRLLIRGGDDIGEVFGAFLAPVGAVGRERCS